MAISTKSELHTAVANWLNRSDLTSRIPEFITLAEASFNRNLRTRQMLTRTTTTATAQYIGLPSDFQEMLNIELTSTSPPKRLIYVTSDRSDDFREQDDNTTGKPKYFTIEGTAIQLLPTPDASYTLQINYYKSIPALSGVADSGDNWLLVSHPDVYLYGTLLQASPYLMDPQSTQIWDGLLSRAMQEVIGSDDNSRYAGGTLNMKPKYIYT
ncbi:MAG: hypothetical protein Unbinned2902contig1001_9 [Prokaryotic dsDNA virus sp.]|nr:MAG: hypothetical protein Unbinned2902contig1001_9 [Prokaryotic dsDNA virus sp.]|tara:strand:- start:4649 stop:5284 length:636 start_codon:yes stop_codon:yes gene_type:complete